MISFKRAIQLASFGVALFASTAVSADVPENAATNAFLANPETGFLENAQEPSSDEKYDMPTDQLIRRAKLGDVDSQLIVGERYYFGEDGVTQDYQEAGKWFRRAADQGNADAQYNLAVLYEKGHGVEQSNENAVKWCKLSAEQGCLEAQLALGNYYDGGKGIKRNRKVAAEWFRRAAEAGNPEAQNNLGVCYTKGHGVGRDLDEAKRWFKMAADQGNETAKKNLSRVCSSGIRKYLSIRRLIQWYIAPYIEEAVDWLTDNLKSFF